MQVQEPGLFLAPEPQGFHPEPGRAARRFPVIPDGRLQQGGIRLPRVCNRAQDLPAKPPRHPERNSRPVEHLPGGAGRTLDKVNEDGVVEHLERRHIELSGHCVAQEIESTEHDQFPWFQIAASLDSSEPLGIKLLLGPFDGGGRLKFLKSPAESTLFLQLGLEGVPQTEQMVGVHCRIFQLFGDQRPSGPVVSLPALRMINIQQPFHQCAQAEKFVAQQLRRNVGVEDIAEAEAVIPSQAEDIVACRVKYFFYFGIGHHGSELSDFRQCQRIEYECLRVGRYLDQTYFLEVVIEAVGFYVDCQARRTENTLQHTTESFVL